MSKIVLALLAVSLCAAPALAGSSHRDHPGIDCDFSVGPNDRLARTGDLVINPGETVDDAVALSGNVIVKAGAKVGGSVVAIDGSVRIEKGASVAQSAISLGGKVTLEAGARIGGSRISLGDALEVVGENGNHFQFAFSDASGSFGRKILDGVLHDIRSCRTHSQVH
jgi:hypothetical protein